MSQDYLYTLIIYQSRYFEILNEFFISCTGKTHREFSSLDKFPEKVRLMAAEIKGNGERLGDLQISYQKLEEKLKKLYTEEGEAAYKAAQNLDACKLNLGGSSRFLATQLNATRKAILYSDTVLIPDPVMPWLEKKRDEEAFPLVNLLQATFFVLHLSDLLGNEFDIPPFFIFPSWEKTLEDNDSTTQVNTIQLVTDVFSYYVDSGIKTFEDLIEFGNKSPNNFLEIINSKNLFIAPGNEVGGSLKDEIDKYKLEMRTWRSKSWCDEHLSKSDVQIVLRGITERLQPQYHLLENSSELRSHPYLCVDTQAHYYQLISKMKNEHASMEGVFDQKTNAIMKSLVSSRLDFLANIGDEEIVQIRKTNENVQFRSDLRDLVNSLPVTKLDDLGYVVSEVCSHIELSISKHEKEISIIREKYQAKHKYTALMASVTLGVTLFPVLAPFVGALGLSAVTGKYVADKLSESAEIKPLSHSMMGVLSLAKKKESS